MDVRYGELPLDLLRALFTFEELLKLFLDLVTRLGGDVEEALDVMRRLQQRGILDPGLDLEAFLAAHPEYELRAASEVLAQQNNPLDTGKYFKLAPHLHGTDGFFAAVMERKS